MIRILSNLYHIPDLKHNLITLGTIESNGCKYSAKCGVLKILKGALVFMKGERLQSLYILQGSTMTGSIGITTPLPIEDHSRLWHAHFGHMSKKGMTMLSKRGLLGSKGMGKLVFL